MTKDAPWAERPPHIQRYTDTRNGRERVYFRKAGHRKVELKSAWGTQALADEVAALTIAYNSRGEAWKKRALEHELKRTVDAFAEQGLVRPGLTWHGLRHARGVELANSGASDAQIMSQLDHATPRQAALYRKQAERLDLADAAQDKVDAQVVKLEERRKKRGQAETG